MIAVSEGKRQDPGLLCLPPWPFLLGPTDVTCRELSDSEKMLAPKASEQKYDSKKRGWCLGGTEVPIRWSATKQILSVGAHTWAMSYSTRTFPASTTQEGNEVRQEPKS